MTTAKPILATLSFATLLFAACENPLPPVSCETPVPLDVPVDGTAQAGFCFEDPNEDLMTYSATSANPNIATAVVLGGTTAVTGISAVGVTGVEEGNTAITITATDPGGLTSSVTLLVSVKFPVRIGVTDCTAYNSGRVTIDGWAEALFDLSGLTAWGILSDNDLDDFRVVGSRTRGSLSRGSRWTISISGTPSAIRANDRCYLVVAWDSVQGTPSQGSYTRRSAPLRWPGRAE